MYHIYPLRDFASNACVAVWQFPLDRKIRGLWLIEWAFVATDKAIAKWIQMDPNGT